MKRSHAHACERFRFWVTRVAMSQSKSRSSVASTSRGDLVGAGSDLHSRDASSRSLGDWSIPMKQRTSTAQANSPSLDSSRASIPRSAIVGRARTNRELTHSHRLGTLTLATSSTTPTTPTPSISKAYSSRPCGPGELWLRRRLTTRVATHGEDELQNRQARQSWRACLFLSCAVAVRISCARAI